MFWSRNKKINFLFYTLKYNFTLKDFVYLNLWGSHKKKVTSEGAHVLAHSIYNLWGALTHGHSN